MNKKYNLLGVNISACNLDNAWNTIKQWIDTATKPSSIITAVKNIGNFSHSDDVISEKSHEKPNKPMKNKMVELIPIASVLLILSLLSLCALSHKLRRHPEPKPKLTLARRC